MPSYYGPKGALESQDTSSQDWLEDIFEGALPLFLPDPDDELPPPRDNFSIAGSGDSDKENEPPLQVPPLPWPQRHRLASCLTRIAFGHQSMSSAILEMRDVVLGIEPREEAQGQDIGGEGGLPRAEEDLDPTAGPLEEATEVQGKPAEAGDSSETVTESEDEGLVVAGQLETHARHATSVDTSTPNGLGQLDHLLDPIFRTRSLTTGSAPSLLHVQSPASSAPNTPEPPAGTTSVAAVVTGALNTKRKADLMSVGAHENPVPKKRQITRRLVPIPTESQLEREETSKRDSEMRKQQRVAAGLPPRKPLRRPVPADPGCSTPSTQLIADILGYHDYDRDIHSPGEDSDTSIEY